MPYKVSMQNQIEPKLSFSQKILLLMLTYVDKTAQETPMISGWHLLAPLPDTHGFAGSFAGVSHDTLIVAGGANFPDGGAPWTGSLKKWTNKVFVLDSPGGQWHIAGVLPSTLGYGGSISYKDQLILLGGSNEKGHHSTVLSLEWRQERLSISYLPELPAPVANCSAILLKNNIYVASGISTSDAQQANSNFWRLDLKRPQKGWEELPTWPGPARMLSVLGVQEDKLYLFSGVALVNGQRQYLDDAFRFDPKQGWKRIANLPSAVAAAPTPALCMGNYLIVTGGDNGVQAPTSSILMDNHPGFSDQILAYNPNEDEWKYAGLIDAQIGKDPKTKVAQVILAPVTTAAVHWKDLYVIPGGEVRPAVRTNRVLACKMKQWLSSDSIRV